MPAARSCERIADLPYRRRSSQNQCNRYRANAAGPLSCPDGRDRRPVNQNTSEATFPNGNPLLVVGLQHLIAGRADLGAVLLQARQNREVTLIDDGTAELLNVTRAGRLLFGRAAAALRERTGENGQRRQQGKCQENLTHRVPSF